jgi:fatty-acyl-CoA synthase
MIRTKLTRLFSTKKLSYLKGPTTRPPINESISKAFFKASINHEHKPAIISNFQNLELSFGELFQISRRAAANLLDLGVLPGSKLGIYAPNYLEWLVCQYACSLADLHMVNINPAYKPKELEHGLSLTEIETLIVSDNVKPARILDNVDYFLLNDRTELTESESQGSVYCIHC